MTRRWSKPEEKKKLFLYICISCFDVMTLVFNCKMLLLVSNNHFHLWNNLIYSFWKICERYKANEVSREQSQISLFIFIMNICCICVLDFFIFFFLVRCFECRIYKDIYTRCYFHVSRNHYTKRIATTIKLKNENHVIF